MSDIEVATRVAALDGYSVVAVKAGEVLGCENGRGVMPFVRLARALGAGLRGAALFDTVVGRAVALACVHLGVAFVRADRAGQGAVDALAAAGVGWRADRVVPFVTGRDGVSPCMTEELVAGVTDPAEAWVRLERLL